MQIDPPSSGRASFDRQAHARRPEPAADAAKPGFGVDAEDGVDAMPAEPPAFLLEQIEAAAQRLDELTASGRELAYEIDGATGRVRVEVRDTDGGVVGVLSPTEALDVVDGRPLA